jgi:hypothetical protein
MPEIPHVSRCLDADAPGGVWSVEERVDSLPEDSSKVLDSSIVTDHGEMPAVKLRRISEFSVVLDSESVCKCDST